MFFRNLFFEADPDPPSYYGSLGCSQGKENPDPHPDPHQGDRSNPDPHPDLPSGPVYESANRSRKGT